MCGVKNNKPIIGIIGGIGSGKSLVASILGELGCAVIDADRLAHEILEEPDTKRFLSENLGEDVIKSDNSLDRKKIADIIFSNVEKKKLVESYIHPRVIERQNHLIQKYQSDKRYKAIVIDVPLLLESSLKHICDLVIFVESDFKIRSERVRKSRGWSEEEISRREKFLYPNYLKRSIADVIVYNNSTVDDCKYQVEKIFSRFISSADC